MEQELTPTVRHVIVVPATRLPRFDPSADEPEFIADEKAVTLGETDLPCANRLHLATDQGDARLKVGFYGVIVPSPSVLDCRVG